MNKTGLDAGVRIKIDEGAPLNGLNRSQRVAPMCLG